MYGRGKGSVNGSWYGFPLTNRTYGRQGPLEFTTATFRLNVLSREIFWAMKLRSRTSSLKNIN